MILINRGVHGIGWESEVRQTGVFGSGVVLGGESEPAGRSVERPGCGGRPALLPGLCGGIRAGCEDPCQTVVFSRTPAAHVKPHSL